MIVSLFKCLRGYVRIRILGFSPERFMNLCCNRGIMLWDVIKQNDDYEMFISVKDFFKIAPILRKTKTKAIVLERCGFPFFIHRYQKRKLFLFGILFCLIFLLAMSMFIWEIRIDGNSYRTDDVIRDYLRESGIVPGILKNKVDCEAIEKGLRQNFDDITWTSAKIDGTCLELLIKENDVPDIKDKKQSPCDLVADRGGTIIEIITRSGVPVCSKGMTVKQGEILVSGIIPIQNDSGEICDYQYVSADADILMRTSYSYNDSFPMRNIFHIYTGREKRSLSVSFGNDYIVAKSPFVQFTLSDYYTTIDKMNIFKDFSIPVFIEVKHEREYYEASIHYEEQDAIRIARNKLQNYCDDLEEKGVQIITNSVKIDFVNQSCRSHGNLVVLEKAGSRRAVSLHTEDTQ